MSFEGFNDRDCGEHRSVGARAWCYECNEWCYPEEGCKGCRARRLGVEVDRLSAFARWLVALDDVTGPGADERRTVTLTQIIDRARRALGDGEDTNG